MNSQVFSQKYFILKVMCSDDKINSYIAEKINDDEKKLFIINEIVDINIIKSSISEFLNLKYSYNFYDFVECFSENSKFYIVFNYTQGKSVNKILTAERFAFSYRLILIKKIMTEFSKYTDVFDKVRIAMLNSENIIFDENNINFNCKLSAYSFYDGDTIYTEFKKLFRIFFSESEISKNSNLKIIDEKCNKNIYTSVGMILKDLENVTESIDKDEQIKTMLEEKKQKFKALGIKAVAIITVCITVVVIYNRIAQNNDNATVYSEIERIGNVELYENYETETETFEIIYVGDEFDTTEEASIVDFETETASEELSEENSTVDENIVTTEGYAIDTKEKEYTVKEGDTLFAIVTAQYNLNNLDDINKYIEEVRKYNNIQDSNIISRGQVLKLPVIE